VAQPIIIHDDTKEIHITVGVSITVSHNYIVTLLRALDKFLAGSPDTTSLVMRQHGGPDQYQYSISAPLRSWNQVIQIPPSVEATMSFDVPSFWKLSEFSLQRPIRDLLITLVREFQLSECSVTWTH
jgi:hypothetical protein